MSTGQNKSDAISMQVWSIGDGRTYKLPKTFNFCI